jgi:hypothetical protein
MIEKCCVEPVLSRPVGRPSKRELFWLFASDYHRFIVAINSSRFVRLIVKETESRRGRFYARLEASSRPLVISRQPFLDGARLLLEAGVDPDVRIVSRHELMPYDGLQSTVGAAARWTVDDTRTVFVRWNEFPRLTETPTNPLVHSMAGRGLSRPKSPARNYCQLAREQSE